MKEAPNQKVQEKKPLLKFKNTKKYMCLERIWRKKCFWACRQRPLIINDHLIIKVGKITQRVAQISLLCVALTPIGE